MYGWAGTEAVEEDVVRCTAAAAGGGGVVCVFAGNMRGRENSFSWVCFTGVGVGIGVGAGVEVAGAALGAASCKLTFIFSMV